MHKPVYRRLYDLNAETDQRPRCHHLGQLAAPGPVETRWRACAVHGRCSPRQCRSCRDFKPLAPTVRRLDLTCPSEGRTEAGKYFNPSLTVHRGRRLLAYRYGWNHADVRLAELGPDWRPMHDIRLNLVHPLCRDGREDPRFFFWRDQLWLSFCGVDIQDGRKETHQLLCPIRDDLTAGPVMAPTWSRRQWPMEKNWAWFDWNGDLFCIYEIEPSHVVLRLHGPELHLHSATGPRPPWAGGYLRGGAAPVRVGEEFYCWFHGAWQATKRTYNLGLYTFDAKPPFWIRRIIPDPLLLPNADELPADTWNSVVFPCGAVLRGKRWLVSFGYHDKHCEVVEFDTGFVEEALEAVA